MLNYIMKRLVSLIITLFIIITITFFLMRTVPGGPFDTSDLPLNETVKEALMEKYNLNDPLFKQYINFITGIVKFDLGLSYYYRGHTISDIIITGFPITFRLAVLAIIYIILFGIPMGILAAVNKDGFFDKFVMLFAIIGKTIPSFVTATMLLFVFAYQLGWFPIYGIDTFKHFILPSLALSAGSIADMSRINRNSMLETLNQDYIRTARAKGLSKRRVIYKHALRNASIPNVTILGSKIVSLLAGSFVIEKIFALPGIGRYYIESINNRDYTVIIGVTIYYSILMLTFMILIDVIYAYVNPRIRIHTKRVGD